ncbi:hypothetical protein K466DRAFT_137700 [Polyporus arcularius HHB13444]|uniref:Uncharacterized protein n=1 Tax=Polyporus arcularius HHB13444 TaxID=1314778 RepID=A0A5C3PUC9_9APHY|nr:hypothetical protein K466DRAFT_137700 [Polyporus arcularius HHB13444]
MPSMPSILSRLRLRTISQHSTASAPVPQTGLLPTSPPLLPTNAPTLSPSRSEPQLVDRRIIEDLPALLGSLEASHTPSGALRPPRPRKRSGLRTLGIRSRDPSVTRDAQDTASEEKENEEVPPTVPIAAPSAWKGKQRASGSRFSTASPWSTFGRHRPRAPRSPYGSPPSARSSRMASVDSGVLRTSQTASNVASTASVDHSSSWPTDNSHDVSVLSTLPGSGSNLSSHSHQSVAVTFGVRSPQPAGFPLPTSPSEAASQGEAYTSMPVLPSTYSTENVPSRGNTFPRRHKKRKSRSRSVQRDIPPHFTTNNALSLHDLVTSVVQVDDAGRGRTDEASQLASRGSDRRPAIAVPHALREGTRDRPCSPRHLIPPSSSSSSPTSRTLDGEHGNRAADTMLTARCHPQQKSRATALQITYRVLPPITQISWTERRSRGRVGWQTPAMQSAR